MSKYSEEKKRKMREMIKESMEGRWQHEVSPLANPTYGELSSATDAVTES